jgi:DNA-binding CsgD family transcriptional regulator
MSAQYDRTSLSDKTDHSSAESLSALSKQLNWERWVRQIICQVHASLDRDTLLQTVIDGLGRALNTSRCIIVRIDASIPPLVTHEYAQADISPLGLGRTGQFPAGAVACFQRRARGFAELSVLENEGALSAEDLETLADNGIRSMAGAPITHHGATYGVIIVIESGASREWTQPELDMIETVAYETAVALGHSQSYQQVKDQLFNMNLLGNLTQQLTNTLELASRMTKPDNVGEKAKLSPNAQPLSVRELEVLKLIASGLANREIAQRLFLTESTVELHASRIRKKLKLKSRTALVKYACDNGLA